MAKTKQSKLNWLVISLYLTIGCLIYFTLAWQVFTEAASSPINPSWANPAAKTIKQVGPASTTRNTPVLLDNTDCILATYRLPTSSEMANGCFSASGLGLLESDSGIAIFNGTDEGLLLQPFSTHQVLVPWPNHTGLFVLDTVSTGGAYISLYTNPTPYLKDQRNNLQQLTSKQLSAIPDTQIRDKLGQKLVINSETLAFSSDGSWLVAETLNGSFVRIDLASFEFKPFARSYSTSGSPALLQSRIAISGDGHSVAIYNKDSMSLRVYDLTNCSVVGTNLTPENCQYFDYLPFIKDQIPGLQSIRHLRFVNEYLLSFEAYNSGDTGTINLLAPTAGIDHLIDYLGMGDSYTSGEGAFDYTSGTDLPDNMCHLSIRSYPFLLTNDLFSSLGGHSVACSGAVINDIASLSDNYTGQIKNGLDFKHLKDENQPLLSTVMTEFKPGYVAQQRFVGKYQPAIITVSVGGDDIGFGKILEQCVGLHLSIHRSDSDCFSTYEDRLEILQLIDRTQQKWLTLFNQIKQQAPSSTIYVIGYPQIALDSGNCALNVHLSKSELEFGTELINYLNKTIALASQASQVHFVDISNALAGHRMCETQSQNVAVNGLTAGKDAGIFGIGMLGRESYHPNTLGQQLMENEILKLTNRLALGHTNSSQNTPSTAKLLSAPKTNRQILNRLPANITPSSVIERGSVINLSIKGSDFGLKAAANYVLQIDGTSGQIANTLTATQNGDLSGQLSLPLNITTGGHTIDIIGKNQADQNIDITQPIFVPINSIDFDGDGQSNQADSCPTVINSEVDSDRDNIDDVCDAYIGQVSSNTPSASSLSAQIIASTEKPSTHTSSTTQSASQTQTAVSGSTSSVGTQSPTTPHPQASQNPKPAANTAPKQNRKFLYILHFEWSRWLYLTFIFWVLLILLVWILAFSERSRTWLHKKVVSP